MAQHLDRRTALALLTAAAAGGAGVFAGCATRPAGPDPDGLDDLVARHTAASGGAAAIEAVQAIEYRLHITEPTFQVDGTYVTDRRGRMRIDVHADGARVYTEAWDGRTAWQMGPDGVAKPSAPTGAAALWHGASFPGKLLGLHEMARQGHVLLRLPAETLDGQRFDVIRLTFSDGFATRLYFDPATHLLARQRDERALHPDLDPTKKLLENRYADWRPVDGVMRSFGGSQVDAATGAELQQTHVTSVRSLVALDDARFAPGAPEA